MDIEARQVTLYRRGSQIEVSFLYPDVPYEEWPEELKRRVFQMNFYVYLPLTKKLVSALTRSVSLNVNICNKRGYWYAKRPPAKFMALHDNLLRDIVNKEVKRYVEATSASKNIDMTPDGLNPEQEGHELP